MRPLAWEVEVCIDLAAGTDGVDKIKLEEFDFSETGSFMTPETKEKIYSEFIKRLSSNTDPVLNLLAELLKSNPTDLMIKVIVQGSRRKLIAEARMSEPSHQDFLRLHGAELKKILKIDDDHLVETVPASSAADVEEALNPTKLAMKTSQTEGKRGLNHPIQSPKGALIGAPSSQLKLDTRVETTPRSIPISASASAKVYSSVEDLNPKEISYVRAIYISNEANQFPESSCIGYIPQFYSQSKSEAQSKLIPPLIPVLKERMREMGLKDIVQQAVLTSFKLIPCEVHKRCAFDLTGAPRPQGSIFIVEEITHANGSAASNYTPREGPLCGVQFRNRYLKVLDDTLLGRSLKEIYNKAAAAAPALAPMPSLAPAPMPSLAPAPMPMPSLAPAPAPASMPSLAVTPGYLHEDHKRLDPKFHSRIAILKGRANHTWLEQEKNRQEEQKKASVEADKKLGI